jgi:hypothetical protein
MTIAQRLSAERAADHGQRLSTAEAAVFTGLSASTLAKLRVFGGGPHYRKLLRRVVYDTRDLDDWLVSKARSCTSETGAAA